MRLYSPFDLTGNVNMIEKLVFGRANICNPEICLEKKVLCRVKSDVVISVRIKTYATTPVYFGILQLFNCLLARQSATRCCSLRGTLFLFVSLAALSFPPC